jgi:hypothetical protein
MTKAQIAAKIARLEETITFNVSAPEMLAYQLAKLDALRRHLARVSA